MIGQDELREACNEACDCGGGEPEDCCPACEVWHRLKSTASVLPAPASAVVGVDDAGHLVREGDAASSLWPPGQRYPEADRDIRLIEGFKAASTRRGTWTEADEKRLNEHKRIAALEGELRDYDAALAKANARVRELEAGIAISVESRACRAEAHAANLADRVKSLSHHLTEKTDPCKDRGVDWPCDVAQALIGLSAPEDCPVGVVRREQIACPLCAGRGYVPDPRLPGSARVVWCSCPAGVAKSARFGEPVGDAAEYVKQELGVPQVCAAHEGCRGTGLVPGPFADPCTWTVYCDCAAGEERIRWDRERLVVGAFAASVKESVADRAERRTDAVLDADGKERGRR